MSETEHFVLRVPHGGSGTGMSYWGVYAERCLIAADYHEEVERSCSETAPALVLGTYVHLLLSADRGLTPERTKIIDYECGNIQQDLLDEAFRIYNGYWEAIGDSSEFADDKVIAREFTICGSEIENAMGFSPITAGIDVIVQKPTGEFWIYDYKTSGTTGNFYDSGSYKLQRWLYCMAAQAIGYNIAVFVNRQIVKNKKILVHDYRFLPPSPAEKAVLQNYLIKAKEQKERGVRCPHLSSCGYCAFKNTCEYTA